jgi:hypothetical protein
VLLGVAIVMAEQLGRARSFPQSEMRVHLVFAKTAAVLVLPVVITGVLLARARGSRVRTWRRAHRVCVIVFLAAALAATGTGVWVFSLSEVR